MSLERVLRVLESFGLARQDAEIYIYLAKKGPKNERDLSDALRIAGQQLSLSLKSLQTKGIVLASTERVGQFSAVAFEEAFDSLVTANIERAAVIKETKEELIASWKSSIKQKNT